MLVNKRILIINASKYFSGSELSICELGLKLANKYEVYWAIDKRNQLIRHVKGNVIKCHFINVYYRLKNLFIIPFIISSYRYLKLNLFLARQVSEYAFDIVYFNTIKSVFACPQLLFNPKIKKVVHIRDNIKSNYLLSFILKRVDSILVISSKLKEELAHKKLKIELIHNSIHLDKWKANIAVKSSDNITIGIVSQFTPWKNHLDFIKVAKIINREYPNVRFLMVGDILNKKDIKYKNSVLSEIENYGLEDCIEYMGFCENMHNIYSEIDILVHTAINEPFGRVLIEAMAMEIPVIAYDCGGPQDIISEGITGYLAPPYEYKMLGCRTKDLIDNHDLRLKMGKEGRKRVHKFFNISNQLVKIEKVLNQL